MTRLFPSRLALTIGDRRSFLLLAIIYALSSATSHAADAKHLLRYKFEMGEVLRYRVEHRAHVNTRIDETSQEVESTTESVKAWKVTDVLPGGEIEFIHMVESARMTNRRPQHDVAEFDSRDEGEPPPFFAAAARSIGVPLTLIRMTPTGEIVRREEKHPQPKVTEDMPITMRLPDKAVAVGAKWSQSYDVSAQRKSGAQIKIKTRRLCKLESVKAGIAVISVDYQILTPVDPYVKSQLVERLTAGTVRFDIERGRIVAEEQRQERLMKPGEKLAARTAAK